MKDSPHIGRNRSAPTRQTLRRTRELALHGLDSGILAGMTVGVWFQFVIHDQVRASATATQNFIDRVSPSGSRKACAGVATSVRSPIAAARAPRTW